MGEAYEQKVKRGGDIMTTREATIEDHRKWLKYCDKKEEERLKAGYGAFDAPLKYVPYDFKTWFKIWGSR